MSCNLCDKGVATVKKYLVSVLTKSGDYAQMLVGEETYQKILELQRIRDEEIELVKKVLSHPAGFDLGLFSLVGIRSHCDGYEVSWYGEHKDFTDLDAAVRFFVDKRRELQLGLDIEAELMKGKQNE